eukprot:scaffold98886_cov21-Tisochrysis_lutea.AAC.2
MVFYVALAGHLERHTVHIISNSHQCSFPHQSQGCLAPTSLFMLHIASKLARWSFEEQGGIREGRGNLKPATPEQATNICDPKNGAATEHLTTAVALQILTTTECWVLPLPSA